MTEQPSATCGAQELQPMSSILSGGVTVLVDQTSENLPPLNRVRRAQLLSSAGVDRRALLESAVRSVCVVMRLVLGEHVRELLFAENQHSIQALAANCADSPLGVGVGFRRVRWTTQHCDAGVGEDGVEDRGELRVPIADQEPGTRQTSPAEVIEPHRPSSHERALGYSTRIPRPSLELSNPD